MIDRAGWVGIVPLMLVNHGKKAATLAIKLSKSISLMDPRFGISEDKVDRLLSDKQKGSMKIMTHSLEYEDVRSVVILTIPDASIFHLQSSTVLSDEIEDILDLKIDDGLFIDLFERIESDDETKIWEKDFVILNLKKDYAPDTIQMEFTEMDIIYSDEIYRITRNKRNFNWRKLDFLDIN